MAAGQFQEDLFQTQSRRVQFVQIPPRFNHRAGDFGSIRIDPRLPKDKKEAGDYTSSIAIIDACKPYHWMNGYPPTTKISEELLKRTDEKWGRLLRE